MLFAHESSFLLAHFSACVFVCISALFGCPSVCPVRLAIHGCKHVLKM